MSKHVPPLSIRRVTRYHYMLHFQLLRTAFQANNSIRSTTASIASTQVSNWSHNVCTANCHLHDSVERAIQRTKVSFDRTMMYTLTLLRLVKKYILGQSGVEQWRNWAYSYSHYQVEASVSQSDSQSIENSVKTLKFHT